MRIASRYHFLPMFLALSCLGLLLIPIYYVDVWSTGATHQRVTADHPEEEQLLATTLSQRYLMESDNSGNRTNGPVELTIAPFSNLVNNKPWPRVRPPPPINDEGVVNLMAMGFPLHRSVAEVADFALRMARDRLRIEKYGPEALKKRPPLRSGQSINAIESVDDNVTKPAAATQVLIVTYLRGGTTFFGDLLNEYPGTFYHFEPLHMVSLNDQVQSEEEVSESINLLRHLLRCQYESVPQYVTYVRQSNNRFLFEHNRRLWFACQFHPSLCFEQSFLSSVCKLHPIHMFKIVRLRLAHARRLLHEFPSLRIIYLVRDPRGLYSSRRDLPWCNATRSCIDPFLYCTDMRKDLAVATKLKALMPDRFLALRYEDISLDTENQAKRVLDFLGLSPHPRVHRFIKSHTKARVGENLGGPYSTKRDSKKTAFLWRRKLSPQEIAYVEDACSDVIKRLNYS